MVLRWSRDFTFSAFSFAGVERVSNGVVRLQKKEGVSLSKRKKA